MPLCAATCLPWSQDAVGISSIYIYIYIYTSSSSGFSRMDFFRLIRLIDKNFRLDLGANKKNKEESGKKWTHKGEIEGRVVK